MRRSTWHRYSVVLATMASFAIFNLHAKASNDVISLWNFETGTAGNPPGGAGCGGTGAPACPVGSDITGISTTTGPGTALGHHASAATTWSNPAGNGSAESWSANNYGVGDYFQFQSSTTGVTDIGLIFDQTSSSTGPRDWKVQYSLDGSSFTDSGQTYTALVTTWSASGTSVLDTKGIDLRTIPALNNQANVYFRMVVNSNVSANGTGTIATTGTSRLDNVKVVNNFVPLAPPPPPPTPRLPQNNDVVFALNAASAGNTFELVSGPASLNGGVVAGTPWTNDAFMESVRFDNLGGQMHNAHGNLLGVNFNNGGSATTPNGQIYSFGTQTTIPAPAGQLIGNTGSTDPKGQSGLPASALGGISVAPNNSKIAVSAAGNAASPGAVYVYDYTAGDTHGAGAALSGGRSTGALIPAANTQGTTWLDNNTVAVFAANGGIFTIDATTMATTGAFAIPGGVPSTSSILTALTYNPAVSPYVWALYSGFSNPNTVGRLYVLNPADFSLQQAVNLDSALGADTPRDLALDSAGNLYISGFGSTIDIIPGAAASATTASINAASLVRWYKSNTFSSFNGLDVGFAAGVTGDYNADGKVNAQDYVIWRKTNINGAQGYTDWRNNFDTGGAGSGAGLNGASVPEPASAVLFVIGLAAFCSRRRGA